MPQLRFDRDRRGYETTALVEAAARGRGKRLLYWFRTPPGVRVGRAPIDETAIRLLEEHNPDVEFDWTRILKAPPPAEGQGRRDRDQRDRDQRGRREARPQNPRSRGGQDSGSRQAPPPTRPQPPPMEPAPEPAARGGREYGEEELLPEAVIRALEASASQQPASSFEGVLPSENVEPPPALDLEQLAQPEPPGQRDEPERPEQPVRERPPRPDAPSHPAHPEYREPPGQPDFEPRPEDLGSASYERLGAEGLLRLRARYAEVMARIAERPLEDSARDELKLQAERLNPDAWVTSDEVAAALEQYETVFEGLRGVVGRHPRGRRRGRRQAP